MTFIITSIVIGLIAGFLGGQFGVGGGLITTPAIRLILQQSALIAVGTPLPIIIPTALSGFYNYHKSELVDYKAGLTIGLIGATASILGAYLTPLASGSLILLITAILITIVSLRYLIPRPNDVGQAPRARLNRRVWKTRPTFSAIIIGIIAGFASGFLGLGGGFVIIPALTILMGTEIKKAFGTSLLAIIFIAIPGSIAHYLLGNVAPIIAFFIAIGVIPGAYFGSRTTIALPSNIVRILFGFYLLLNAIFLALNELLL